MWSNMTWQNRQKLLWLSLTKPLARVQELPRSLPRRPRKAQLQLTHLTSNCALFNSRTSQRPKKPQRILGQGGICCKGDFPVLGNYLSADAKYAWNKINKEQLASAPYMDIQDISKKGHREPFCK
jgi:hypothetical protein